MHANLPYPKGQRAEQWNNSADIRSILAEVDSTNGKNSIGQFSSENSAKLLSAKFDRQQMASKGLKYERLDQLTMEILLGINGRS